MFGKDKQHQEELAELLLASIEERIMNVCDT